MRHPTRTSAVALIAASGVALATPAAGESAAPRQCVKTFTVAMFRNAAITAYAGARTPTRRDLANLARYERCSRHPWARPVDRRIWARSKAANALRRNPFQTAIASWYEDGGATASGYHAAYGFASLILAFGTRVEFCYPPGSARCVVATDDDHGPYVGGRTFDLGQSTAGALGFGGVGAVAWRIMSAP